REFGPVPIKTELLQMLTNKPQVPDVDCSTASRDESRAIRREQIGEIRPLFRYRQEGNLSASGGLLEPDLAIRVSEGQQSAIRAEDAARSGRSTHFPPGVDFPQSGAPSLCQCQKPLPVRAKSDRRRAFQGQFAVELSRVRVPDSDALGSAIPPVTAGDHPPAVRADRGEPHVVLRAEFGAPSGLVPV